MKNILEILFLLGLVTFVGLGCKPDSSPQGKIQAPSLKFEVTNVSQSECRTSIFVSLRYAVAEGQVLFDTYPNHHRFEISLNGADFRDVGKGHYVHGPFTKSYIKAITTDQPYDIKPPVCYKLDDITFDDIKSVKIRMTYVGKSKIDTVYPGESVDITVWAGQLVSQEYVLREETPNQSMNHDKQ